GTVDEIGEQLDLSTIGAVTTKSITPEPRDGNPAWRVAPVKAGMLNAIGLANPGVEGFLRDWAPRLASVPCPVFGSIAGFSIEDYAEVAGAFDAIGAMPAAELNVSCPNVKHGVEFGADPVLLGELVSAVRAKLTRMRLFVKLPPVAVPTPHSIIDLSRAASDNGADGLCLCNTMPAMAIDVDSGEPLLGNITGGLSGPAVHPIVTKLIYETHQRFARDAGIPIVGIGGVMDWRDAAEFMLAGAAAVQVGTASFVNPRRIKMLSRDLSQWLSRSRRKR
ncbi:MAG: dihydroorotate dehydrogenase, partial [Planctomycetota bacterium]